MLREVKNLYKEKALVPETPWIKVTKPVTPNISVEKSSENYRISWNSKEKEKVFRWVLFAKYGETWETEILEKENVFKTLPGNKNGQKLNTVAIKSIDRLSNESDYDAKQL